MDENLTSKPYKNLFATVSDLYHLSENRSRLLFHGWHHIKFVHDKAIEFAKDLGADVVVVASAALVHDLNYVFTVQLDPEAAKLQIIDLLQKAGFDDDSIKKILEIVISAYTVNRAKESLSLEAKALSDADTLFKALPITPILFASRYITENRYDIRKLANKVVGEQEPLMKSDNYFYSKLARKMYLKWAQINLDLWKNVIDSLEDPSINEMLQNATDLGVL